MSLFRAPAMGHALHLTTEKNRHRNLPAVISCGRVTTACVSSSEDWEVSRGSQMQQNEFSLFAATSNRNLRNVYQQNRLRFPFEHSCPFFVFLFSTEKNHSTIFLCHSMKVSVSACRDNLFSVSTRRSCRRWRKIYGPKTSVLVFFLPMSCIPFRPLPRCAAEERPTKWEPLPCVFSRWRKKWGLSGNCQVGESAEEAADSLWRLPRSQTARTTDKSMHQESFKNDCTFAGRRHQYPNHPKLKQLDNIFTKTHTLFRHFSGLEGHPRTFSLGSHLT